MFGMTLAFACFVSRIRMLCKVHALLLGQSRLQVLFPCESMNWCLWGPGAPCIHVLFFLHGFFVWVNSSSCYNLTMIGHVHIRLLLVDIHDVYIEAPHTLLLNYIT